MSRNSLIPKIGHSIPPMFDMGAMYDRVHGDISGTVEALVHNKVEFPIYFSMVTRQHNAVCDKVNHG